MNATQNPAPNASPAPMDARRAFRREVTDQDIKPFLARVKSRLDEDYSFEQAIRVGLKGIMVSPDFLFLREHVPGEGARILPRV